MITGTEKIQVYENDNIAKNPLIQTTHKNNNPHQKPPRFSPNKNDLSLPPKNIY